MALTLTGRAQSVADSLQPAMPHLPSGNGVVTVSGTLTGDSLVLGSQTTLELRVTGAGSTPLRFPTLEELTNGPVEALAIHFDTVRNKKKEITEIIQQVTLTSFDAGQWPVTAIILAGDSTAYEAFMPADSLYLTVVYAAEADTNNIVVKEDAKALKEPYTFWEIFRWVLLALAVAAMVALLVWILKRRKAHKPVVALPKLRQVPADSKALSELETLRRKELWQKGRIKRYYTELTDIVRRYLRNQCGMNAAEMTTKQTLAAFHRTADWNADAEQLLRQLLERADMVKFAKSQPASHEHDEAMQNAMDFVNRVAQQHRLNHPEEGTKK